MRGREFECCRLSCTELISLVLYGVYCYIDLTWPHDANLMINVVVDVLLKGDALAPVLYLQFDNTARENKNQYVMTFLAYLVQAGIFSEV